MENAHEEEIIRSWDANAHVWTNAVRTHALESRKLVTNEAIVNAVLRCGGNRMLDVGCGEGWLSHELMKKGMTVTGFDVSAELIAQAQKESTATFHVTSYQSFAADPVKLGRNFDVVVCNFSLLGDQIHYLLRAIHDITNPSGHLLIQTLHPYSSVGDLRYEDGWREEKFNGLPGEWSPMPWYFRTMGSWMRELAQSGWKVHSLQEPLHPATGIPASLILDCTFL